MLEGRSLPYLSAVSSTPTQSSTLFPFQSRNAFWLILVLKWTIYEPQGGTLQVQMVPCIVYKKETARAGEEVGDPLTLY